MFSLCFAALAADANPSIWCKMHNLQCFCKAQSSLPCFMSVNNRGGDHGLSFIWERELLAHRLTIRHVNVF